MGYRLSLLNVPHGTLYFKYKVLITAIPNLQLYLFLSKQFNTEFIEAMLDKTDICVDNLDFWNDNLLHNLCCNDSHKKQSLSMSRYHCHLF